MSQSFYIFGGVGLFLAVAIYIADKYLSHPPEDTDDNHASNDPIMPSDTRKGYPR